MTKYPHLFKPIQIANHTYKNRILCAPMYFGFLGLIDGDMSERVYGIIEARAAGGAAEVIVGETQVNNADAPDYFFPGTEVDYAQRQGHGFDAYKKYADLIKKHDTIALIEIFHAGYEKRPLPWGEKTNPWGPMGFVREDGVPVEAFDAARMKKVREDFVTCSAFMKTAGFDGICIHGGHGFLFTQFLSPSSNQRIDEYGGSLENRGRFPREIIADIRKEIGQDFIIELRINGADLLPGGSTNEDMAEFCSTLDGLVDIIHVSSGFKSQGYATHTFTSMYDAHGIHVEHAANIKKKTKIPVTVVGGINSPEFAERIIAEGKVDFVSLGRQIIADPEFANKACSGRENEIRKCVRCYHCYPGSPEIPGDKGMVPDMNKKPSKSPDVRWTCSINPAASYEIDIARMSEPRGKRNVVVIGGGPAGMQAAITACDRGHKVTLVEKDKSLGGLLSFTDTDVHKVDLKNFKDLLIREVKRRKINVQINTEATPGFLAKLNPDVLILTIGAIPRKPRIPGLDTAIHVLDVYKKDCKIGKKVTMLGGGLAGCETALYLADKGHHVTIVEMLDRLASEATGMALTSTIREIEKRNNITVRTSTECIEIDPLGVHVRTASNLKEVIKGDTVVYSLGMDAKRDETERLRSAAGKADIYEAGDCIRGAKVYEAVSEGFMAAMKII